MRIVIPVYLILIMNVKTLKTAEVLTALPVKERVVTGRFVL